MKRSLLLSFIALFIVCCNIDPAKKRLYSEITPKVVTPSSRLKDRKDEIDAFSIHSKNKSLVLVKLSGQPNLQVVRHGHWPDHIECIYNVFKDASNKIVMIFISPFSDKQNVDVNYTHYFDNSGKTFAFEKQTSFSNSGCSGVFEGVAYETNSKYFDSDFKVISQDYDLTDGHGKKLNKNKCRFEINMADEQIYPDVVNCLRGYHIGEKMVMLN